MQRFIQRLFQGCFVEFQRDVRSVSQHITEIQKPVPRLLADDIKEILHGGILFRISDILDINGGPKLQTASQHKYNDKLLGQKRQMGETPCNRQ